MRVALLRRLVVRRVLEDFDIVMTGTPAGVGVVQAGKRFCGRALHGEQELVSAEWLAQ